MSDKDSPMPVVENVRVSEAAPKLIREGLSLSGSIWQSEMPFEQRMEDYVRQATVTDPAFPVMWHMVREGGSIMAMARSFRRVVVSSSGRQLPVLALAGVCSRPGHRRRGLGRAVVVAAFSRVEPDLPVCFFQTGVPLFYLGLGARPVANHIFDSTGAPRAFWEPHAMIYPRDASWPLEAIDLLGEGW